MTKSVTLTIAMLPALLSLLACTGTDTGNPFTQPLIVDAHSSRPGEIDIGIALPQAGTAVVREAIVSTGDIGLYEDCGMGAEIIVGNFGSRNYASDTLQRQDFEVEENRYCELRVPWTRTTAGPNVPDEAVDTTIYLSGDFGSGTPFVIRSKVAGTVIVTAIGESFELGEDLGGLFLGFDLATWLDGIELSTADTLDGRVVIDADNNTTLLDDFDGNVARGLELYRDVNGSGGVDGPEDVLLAKEAP